MGQYVRNTLSVVGSESLKNKRSIDVQTGYVYRKASERTPHYSGRKQNTLKQLVVEIELKMAIFIIVILGSSGKTVLGPSLTSDQDESEIHRVQGFVVNTDDVETGSDEMTLFMSMLVDHKHLSRAF